MRDIFGLYLMVPLSNLKSIRSAVWRLSFRVFILLPMITHATIEFDLLPAANKAGLWGYIDAKTGDTIIAPKYSSVEFFEDGVAPVRYAYKDKIEIVKDRYGDEFRAVPVGAGLIDRTGREVLPPNYGEVKATIADVGEKERIPRVFTVNFGDKTGFFHADGHWLLPLGEYERLQINNNGDITYGECLYIAGKEYCAPSGYALQMIDKKRKFFLIKSKQGLRVPVVGLIKWTGESIIPADYQDIVSIDLPEKRWIASRLDGKIAATVLFSTLNGKEIDANNEKDKITIDVFDESGKKLFTHRAHNYPKINKDRFSYQRQGKTHTISALTGEAMPESAAETGGEKYTFFRENGLQGVKNTAGKTILPPQYADVKSLGGDLFSAGKPEADEFGSVVNYGVIDAASRIILPFKYKEINKTNYPDAENCSFVVQERASNNFGLVDRRGKMLTPMQYLNAFYFNKKGQAIVYKRKVGSYSVIDHTGKEIIPAEYSSMHDTGALKITEDTFYEVKKEGENGKYGAYDSFGKEIIPVRFDFITFLEDAGGPEKGWVITSIRTGDNEKMKGAYNFLTKVSIPEEYEDVRISKRVISARKTVDGKAQYSFLDLKGNLIATAENLESPAFYKGDEIVVRKDRKIGLLDSYGKTLIPFKYRSFQYAAPSFWWASESKYPRTVLVGSDGVEYRIKD